MSEIFDLNELSGYLRIPKSTLYKLSEAGKIPSFKVGKQLRFRKGAIDKWIADEENKKKGRLANR
jgi:excisionase family DNA binding protein